MIDRQQKPIRLVHTSDLHLGEHAFLSAGGVDEAAQRVLKAVVDLSLQIEASVIMIAGDLFDNNQVSTVTAELAATELLRAAVPVVILPGNHDCLVSDSVYKRVEFSRLAPNIRVFTAPQGERFSFPGLDLAIWGKPISSYGGKSRPMAGVPPRGREQWQIAVAHGYYVAGSLDRTHSFQISDSEILQSGYDYVALGHWSIFRCIGDGPVKACYSGSAAHTGSVVTIDLPGGGGVQVESRPLPL